MLKLTSENVSQVVGDCLRREGEAVGKIIEAQGVIAKFGFDASKVRANKEKITELLSQLDDKFHEGTGDGYSFLAACVDKNGEQWAEHVNIDELICLGIAIDKVKFCMPRELWDLLPGGMPYFVVLNKSSARAGAPAIDADDKK